MKYQRFTVEIPEANIRDLVDRLEKTRLPHVPDETSWANGTASGYMAELIEYWQNKYDWRQAESEINSFDNYKTVIDT